MARKAKTVDPATEARNAARLEDWERRSLPAIIAAALIPLVGVSTGTQNFGLVGNLIEIACWLVFVVDLVVHVRLHPRYLHEGMGRFDLSVVILTSPWYLIPGVDGGAFVTLLRLARLARVAMVGLKTPILKRTLERLGKPFLYVTIMLFVCAAIAMRAEDHKHGFATYGDALWWGVVTITTVGYGDIVPESRVGRVTAAILMITGVALLGTVAASLASLFRLEDKADEDAAEVAASAPAPPPDQVTLDVSAELRALREEVAALRAELAARPPELR
jgi:voltage-gated potassium channel